MTCYATIRNAIANWKKGNKYQLATHNFGIFNCYSFEIFLLIVQINKKEKAFGMDL